MKYFKNKDPHFMPKFYFDERYLRLAGVLCFVHTLAADLLTRFVYREEVLSTGKEEAHAMPEFESDRFIDIPETLFYKTQRLSRMYHTICINLIPRLAKSERFPPISLSTFRTGYKYGECSGPLTCLFQNECLGRVPESFFLEDIQEGNIVGFNIVGNARNIGFTEDTEVYLLSEELYLSYQNAYCKFLEGLVEACAELPPKIYADIRTRFDPLIRELKEESASHC